MRPSRCLDARNAPQSIHWAVIAIPAVDAGRELLGVIKTNTNPAIWADIAGDVRAILERFQRCTAIDPDDVVPVARHESLWEIRIDLLNEGLLQRIYETEMKDLPGHIVALLSHHKVVVDGDDAETRRLQNVQIGLACDRWDAGRSHFWGVV